MRLDRRSPCGAEDMARQQIRDDDVPLDLPFGGGRWLVRNSSGNRVPSYETKAFGSSHAIDFAHVDERGRSAPRLSRSLVRSEPPEVFDDFGPPNLSPTSSSVVVAHDGEPDHEARRPQPSPPYMLTQGRLVSGTCRHRREPRRCRDFSTGPCAFGSPASQQGAGGRWRVGGGWPTARRMRQLRR